MSAAVDFPQAVTASGAWGIAPFGFEGGYHTEGDVDARVTQTADGVDLNRVWDEIQRVNEEWNKGPANLAALLSYWHTSAADAVPATFPKNMFEEASEYGEPKAIKPGTHALVGFPFKDYDVASRFTWKFLRDASARQVRAAHDEALRADSSLVSGKILSRLFDPTQGENDQNTPVYGLYNGDGVVPPPFAGETFDGNHTHYLVTGNATIDSGDVELAIKHVRQHGFGVAENGQTLLLLCHPNQADVVMSWKKGQESATDVTAKYDALPSVNAPAFEISGQIIGQQAPADFNGVPVTGSYGPAFVVESHFIPNNYFAVVATSGHNSPTNVIGVREHTNAAYRGLRLLPGNVNGYPLQESFYTRAFGVGVRHRGAAVVTQVKASGSYDIPDVSA